MFKLTNLEFLETLELDNRASIKGGVTVDQAVAVDLSGDIYVEKDIDIDLNFDISFDFNNVDIIVTSNLSKITTDAMVCPQGWPKGEPCIRLSEDYIGVSGTLFAPID